MAEMRGVAGLSASFRMAKVGTGQVLLHAPEFVHCDFGTQQDEEEIIAWARENKVPVPGGAMLGGAGRVIIRDAEDSTIEIFGSVRHLAPLLRQAADAFEARLAELPTS